MSKTPAQPRKGIDPIFDFAQAATVHLPRRKQRVFAAYYVRLLQTHPSARTLREAVPAHLYRALRHFLAESDWDGREVVWRAAAQALPHLAIDWLALRVTAIASRYTFVWLVAYDGDEGIPLDLVGVGPADVIRGVPDYLPAQLDVLRGVPDPLLQQAPLALAGAAAEHATFRAELDQRGITYSAKVRPGSELLGEVREPHGARRLHDLLASLPGNAELRDGPTGIRWCHRPVVLQSGTEERQAETLVAYWHQDQLASVALTNAHDSAEIERIYDPARPDCLARPRRPIPWRTTTLRGTRAWEHHLALYAVWHDYRVKLRVAQTER